MSCIYAGQSLEFRIAVLRYGAIRAVLSWGRRIAYRTVYRARGTVFPQVNLKFPSCIAPGGKGSLTSGLHNMHGSLLPRLGVLEVLGLEHEALDRPGAAAQADRQLVGRPMGRVLGEHSALQPAGEHGV